MTARRTQLIGYTTGTELTVSWNGQQVFDGAVAAQGDTDNLAVLAEWQCDTAVTGQIPLQISNGSGQVAFATIFMNRVRPGANFSLADQAVWPVYEPTPDELHRDLQELSDAELDSKYSIDKVTLVSYLVITPIATEDNLREPFEITEANDGKLNVTISGVPHERHSVREYWGAWQWVLHPGQVLNCDILVDPAVAQG